LITVMSRHISFCLLQSKHNVENATSTSAMNSGAFAGPYARHTKIGQACGMVCQKNSL
jgi:hypothetical protein